MDVTQVQARAQQFIDALHALEQGDESAVEGLVALYSEDARLTNAALKLAGKERQGHDGVREFWTEYRHTFQQVYSEFAQITANEEASGLFWTTKGADTEGNPLEYDGVSLLVFDEHGDIAQFRGYYDTRSLEKTVPANQQ